MEIMTTHATRAVRIRAGFVLVILAFLFASVVLVPARVAYAQTQSQAQETPFDPNGTGSANYNTADASSVLSSSACTGAKSWVDGGCWLRWITGGIGNILVAVGVFFAEFSGRMFEFLLGHVVVGFGSLFSAITNGIDVGWTFFRDIADIIIIGMFVFTAVCLILGITQFGDKRRIARVLIIAILLNFSLLFTKMIVDVSNFTAAQFYTSMLKSDDIATPVTRTSSNTVVSPGTGGIAAKFMQYIGVNGIFDSSAISVGYSAQNAWVGLLYGLVSFVILAAIACVFVFGSFLLVSRAVSLIFLMLVSAIAFASWLIPGDFIELGWERWWRSLIHNAVLAPLLMMLLWANLMIAHAFSDYAHSTWNVSTLGQLLASGQAEQSVPALVNATIIIALLFVSLRVASMVSGSVAGGGLSRVLSAASLMVPVLGAAKFGGFAGRTVLGGMSSSLANRTERWRGNLAGQGKNVRARMVDELFHKPTSAVAKSDFNFMNTAAGKQLAKLSGLDGAGITTYGGFKGVRTEKAKGYAAQAERLKPNTQVIRDKIIKQSHDERLGVASTHLEQAAKNLVTVRAAHDDVESSREVRQHKSEKAAAELEKNKKEAELNDLKLKRNGADKKTISKKQGEIDAVDSRIKAAAKNIEDASAATKQVLENAQKIYENAQRDKTRVETDVLKNAVADKYRALRVTEGGNLEYSVADNAATLAHGRAARLFGLLGNESDDSLAQLARDQVKKGKEKKEADRLLEGLREKLKETKDPTSAKK